jgi:hypothetical protein
MGISQIFACSKLRTYGHGHASCNLLSAGVRVKVKAVVAGGTVVMDSIAVVVCGVCYGRGGRPLRFICGCV